MNKIVRKLRPSDFWRIGEHESWFHDMAAKGFHLKRMGFYFAKFVKGEPREMRYRIEVSMNRGISQEQLAMYTESGWDYVTSYQYFHVFSSPFGSGAPELHTDPAEQSYTLQELDKKLALSASLVVISMLLIFGMVFSIWFLDGTPTYTLVEGSVIQLTILTLFIGYTGYSSLQAARSIRALRKSLIEGKPIDHRAPWEKHYRLKSTISFIFTIMVGLSAILPFLQLVKGDTKTLPEESVDLPIVRLADVEQDPSFIGEKSSHIVDDVDWGNRYSYQWTPFAPVQYDTDEQGVVPGKMWGDGSGEYSPSISSKVYQLNISAMAEPLISDLLKRYTYRDEVFDEIEHTDFDHLLIFKEENSMKAIVSKGKAVVYVNYHGYADINSVIENIEERIELISE